MAIDCFEGFDHQAAQADFLTNPLWTISNSGGSLVWQDTALAGSGKSVRITSGGGGSNIWAIRALAAAYATVWVEVDMEWINGTPQTAAENIGFRDTGTTQLLLTVQTDGTIAVYRGATLLYRSVISPLAQGTGKKSRIGFISTIHNTTGSWSLYFDTVLIQSQSGINTRNGTNNQANQISLGSQAVGGGNTTGFRFDNFVCGSSTGSEDGGQAPDRFRLVEPRAPISNSSVAFTGVSGANWANVDDPSYNAADYNESATVGALDEFNFGALSTTPRKIYAVKALSVVGRGTSGRNVRNHLTLAGGSRVSGSTVGVGASGTTVEQMTTGGGTLTPTQVGSGIKAGYELVV